MHTWQVIGMLPLLLYASGSPQAALLYVAPDGNDAWSGTLPEPDAARADGPLATLQAAHDAARKLPADEPRRVVVRGGEYLLREPLVLQAQDSGLTIEAAPEEAVTLYGGRRVTGWEPDGGGLWAAELPEVAEGEWDFRMLVVNGRFCQRARLPQEGTFTHLSEFKVPWMSTTGGGWQRKPTQEELTTLQYRPEDLGPWLDIKNAELTVYHMWDESVVGVAAMDEAAHTLTFANPAGHPPGAFGVRKYVVWNVKEGMTEPGQWYLDRSAGKAVYWPLPGEDVAQAEAYAPTVESIIRIEGSQESPVRDVTVRGLTLSVTNTPLQAGGFGAGRFDGAVSVRFAEDCSLEELTLVNVGGQGIRGEDTTRLEIRGCEVHDVGACGIIVRGTDGVVDGNHVHHVGVTYPSAIAVWGGGQSLRIAHNEIHDTPYTAIACGGDDHAIEGNLIYRAMQVLKDGAGIYITFCKRVTLRGNFIRDIEEVGGYGSSAYYLDEQAEDCLVEGNLALRVPRPSHNHMAKNNTIRNNVFICEGDASLTFPKSRDFTFERNIIVTPGKVTFSQPEAITKGADNIIFSGAGAIEGEPLGVRKDDPRLSGAEEGKITFGEGSPAVELGIEPIDVSGAGLPPQWVSGDRTVRGTEFDPAGVGLLDADAEVDF